MSIRRNTAATRAEEEETIRLSFIVTDTSDIRLREVIEGLAEPVSYFPGTEVRPVRGTSGKYLLERHNGEITLESASVRVYHQMIIAGKATSLVEETLRKERIPYKAYHNIPMRKAYINSKIPRIVLPDRQPDRQYSA